VGLRDRNPQSPFSPPPPAPFRLPANLSNVDLVCETIFAAEAANNAWLKAHLAANEPSQYNVPWINQVTQSLCRTMSLRKTLYALDEKLNPKPTAPAAPSTPALVSIDVRAFETLPLEQLLPMKDRLVAQGVNWERLLQRKREHDRQVARVRVDADPTGSAGALVRNTPTPTEPSPLPPINPGPSLGARTSSSATAPAHQSVSAPADSPNSTLAPDTSLSGCAAIRAVPVCPTYHRLIPNAPNTPDSPDAPAPTSESQSSPTLDVGHLTLDNPQSPAVPAPPYRPPWFRPPFPVKPTTSNTPNSS
jgi:hypothetical protein